METQINTATDRTLFFGDIHNHNALGYGVGSLERSIDIAQSHLDFFAFTGHSSWHDMAPMEGGREKHWLAGFERLREAWPKVQELTAAANRDGEFSAFLGFEWHSSHYGDQCVILPDDQAPLVFPDDVADLRRYCIERDGLMIPHHLAYASGHRGVNWDCFDPTCSPVVEIYSEHGNSESDRGPFPYFNHSMGGRVTANTARAALDSGLKFGFAASSDNHRGFPGAYGEGVLGVWADDLTRNGILEGINNRRTIALTGDRIAVLFDVNGHPMGSSVKADRHVDAHVIVSARDEIDTAELIVDGEVRHAFSLRERRQDHRRGDTFQVRFEFGWGPWGDLALDRICDWTFEIEVGGGRLLEVYPCFQSGPFDEDRRHGVTRSGDNTVSVRSHTGRVGAYRQNPNQSIVLHVAGDDRTAFELRMAKPEALIANTTAGELETSASAGFTGPFPAESYLWHRLVREGPSTLSESVGLDLDPGSHYVYPRVRQTNGQMAWASPIFVEVAP